MPTLDCAEAGEASFQPVPMTPAAGSEDWDLPGRALHHVIKPIATINFWNEPAYDQPPLTWTFSPGATPRGPVRRPPSGNLIARVLARVEACRREW